MPVDVAVLDGYAYVADGSAGLRIIRVMNDHNRRRMKTLLLTALLATALSATEFELANRLGVGYGASPPQRFPRFSTGRK